MGGAKVEIGKESPQGTLEERFNILADEVEGMRVRMGQLTFPADDETRQTIGDALDTLLPEKLFDVYWNRIFYYFTNFESIDGWFKNDDGGGGSFTLENTEGSVEINTGAAANTEPVWLQLINVHFSEIVRWDKEQRFRYTIGAAVNDTNVEEYYAFGNVTDDTVNNAADINGYGFWINRNNDLYGVMGDGTTTKITFLQAVGSGAALHLVLEARMSPTNGVVFLVDEVEKGSLNGVFPLGTRHDNLFYFWIMTAGSTSRRATVFSAEYIQLK